MLDLSGNIKKNSHILWSISLIQDQPDNINAQTGKEFREMVDCVIKKENISKITLLTTAKLHRHRIMAEQGISEEDAEAIAKSVESKWFEENQEALDLLEKNKTVVKLTWEEYTSKYAKEMAEAMELIKKYYSEEKEFIHPSSGFIANMYRKPKPENQSEKKYTRRELISFSQNFLFEETAFHIVASNDDENDFNYELYKCPRPEPVKVAHRLAERNGIIVGIERMQEVYFRKYIFGKNKHLFLSSSPVEKENIDFLLEKMKLLSADSIEILFEEINKIRNRPEELENNCSPINPQITEQDKNETKIITNPQISCQ